MKKQPKYLFYLVIFLLVLGNFILVVSGVGMSKQIHEYEVYTAKYKEQNIFLETEVSQVSSLQYASSMSAVLTIDKKINPVYLKDSAFALNQ